MPEQLPPLTTLDTEVARWALDSAGDAVIVIDDQGLVVVWNRFAVELFGYPADEALGRDIDFMIPERLRDGHHVGFSTAIAQGHLTSDGSARRTKALCADGSSVYIDMTFAMLYDDEGGCRGAVAVARPISERETPTRGRKRYRGARVDVTFDSALCNHNGQCVRNMGEVFDTAKRPWINPAVADDSVLEAQLRATVRGCPTGALQILEIGDPDPDPATG